MTEVITIIQSEISRINSENLFNIALMIAIVYFFSRFAKNSIPRLLWIGFGVFVIVEADKVDAILYNLDVLMGIGAILPHIGFLFEWMYRLYDDLYYSSLEN